MQVCASKCTAELAVAGGNAFLTPSRALMYFNSFLTDQGVIVQTKSYLTAPL